MKHVARLLSLLLFLALFLVSCRASAPTADILSAMCVSQSSLPAGQLFCRSAVPGDAEYADSELLAVLYGDGILPPEFEAIHDFTIRLCSFAAPCELAVFQCASQRDAYDVAQMCLRRAERLRISHRETEYAAQADGAQVCIVGKYVLMAVCSDSLSAIEAGRSAAR
jgi:hypothetical protein